jgi:hypothetical protein
VYKLGVMAHTFIPRTWEAETGGSGVQDKLELNNETLSKKKSYLYPRQKKLPST